MSRLVIQSGPESGREIALRPGRNRLGRNADNDVEIHDNSVSGHHCEITPEMGGLRVVDLGSTNGTFVDGEPVQEAAVRPGQRVRLGTCELLFEPAVQIHPQPLAVPVPSLPSGMSPCRNHPQHPAEWVCQRCHQLFCVVCAIPRSFGGKTLHFCMACGGQCVPYGLGSMWKPKEHPRFFSVFPGAFTYPLKGNGPWVMAGGAVFFSFLAFLRAYSFLLFLAVIPFLLSVGYLFLYVKNLIVTSSQGDENPPAWPDFTDWGDVIVGAVQSGGLFVICLGPAWFAFGQALTEHSIGGQWPVGTLVVAGILALIGLAYLPMALLGLAMADSLAGLNPLLIVPSMFRVPAEYLVTCCVIAAVLIVQVAAEIGLRRVPVPVLPALVSWFITLYFYFVAARLLGLLYFTSHDRLKWF
jgi:hypothetical protein